MLRHITSSLIAFGMLFVSLAPLANAKDSAAKQSRRPERVEQARAGTLRAHYIEAEGCASSSRLKDGRRRRMTAPSRVRAA